MVRKRLRQANMLLGGMVGFIGGLLGGALLAALLIWILLPLFKEAAARNGWFAAVPSLPDLIVWALAALFIVLSTLVTMRALYQVGLWINFDELPDLPAQKPE